MLADKLATLEGRITKSSKLRVGYFAQHQVDELHIDETPLDHLRRLRPTETPAKLRARLAGFGLGPDQAGTAVGRLSGGQMQRVALARALYDDPVIVILDEPNSNLDNEGSIALNHAIKQMKSEGKSVMIMAHRPAAIQECEMLLVIDNGVQTAFGPKDEVLQKMVTNHQTIRQAPKAAGGVQ